MGRRSHLQFKWMYTKYKYKTLLGMFRSSGLKTFSLCGVETGLAEISGLFWAIFE